VKVILSASSAAWFLFAATALLTVAHVCATALLESGYYAFGLTRLFNFNYEQNAPTLFNSLLFIAAGCLLMLHGYLERPYRFRWWFAALVAVALGVDEIASIHEPIMFVLGGGVSETTAQLRESITMRWIDLAPYLGFVMALVLVCYWPIIRRLHWSVAGLAVAAIIVYLSGALVLDSITGKNLALVREGFAYHLLITLEEIFEFVGVTLAIIALMRNLELTHPGLTIAMAPQNA